MVSKNRSPISADDLASTALAEDSEGLEFIRHAAARTLVSASNTRSCVNGFPYSPKHVLGVTLASNDAP